jgi:mRNA-degrading endonuclease RelE of RelBE toxin-antitoxin system
MGWSIGISRQADKFLVHNHLPDDFLYDPLARAVARFSGEAVAVDLKRLSAEWEGFYRIRVGKIRIIFSADMHEQSLFVEVVDYRGNAYKR